MWFLTHDGADFRDSGGIATGSGWPTNFIDGHTAGAASTTIGGGWSQKNMPSQGATGLVEVDADHSDGNSFVQIGINPATAGDSTPDTFNFSDSTDAALTTPVESDIVQVTGMDNGTAISIDGSYEYRVCANGTCSGAPAYTNSGGTIDAGEYVQLKLTSSASNSTATVATLTVGTLDVDWSVTTVGSGGGSSLLGSWVTGTTHTAEAGSNRGLILVTTRTGWDDSGETVTSATYGGQALVHVERGEEDSSSTGYFTQTEVWILDEAGIAAASNSTFVVNWSSSSSSISHASAFYENVNQSTPIGAKAKNSVRSSPTTVSTTALS